MLAKTFTLCTMLSLILWICAQCWSLWQMETLQWLHKNELCLCFMCMYMRQEILGRSKVDRLILVGFMAISNYTKEDGNEHTTPGSSFLALAPYLSLCPKSVVHAVSTQYPFYREV